MKLKLRVEFNKKAEKATQMLHQGHSLKEVVAATGVSVDLADYLLVLEIRSRP